MATTSRGIPPVGQISFHRPNRPAHHAPERGKWPACIARMRE